MKKILSRLSLACKKGKETAKLEKELYLEKQGSRELKLIFGSLKTEDKSPYDIVLNKFKEVSKAEDTGKLALRIYKNNCFPLNSFEQFLFDTIYSLFSNSKYKSTYNPL